MFRRLNHRTASLITRLHHIAGVGAWFFIVVSMLHLLFAVIVKWNEPAGVFKAYHTVVDDISYDAYGLTYAGTMGLLLALGQLGVVGTAALTGCSGIGRIPLLRRLEKYRGPGHLVLMGWAGVWLGNFIWLASIDHALDSYSQVFIMSILFGCTVWRGLADWGHHRSRTRLESEHHRESPPRSSRPTDEHEVVKMLRSREVSVSPRIRELSDRAAVDLDSRPLESNAGQSGSGWRRGRQFLNRAKSSPAGKLVLKTTSSAVSRLTELARSGRAKIKKLATRLKSSSPDAA